MASKRDTMTKLKPCPFCGGVAEVVVGAHNFVDAKVLCECGIETGLFDTDDKDKNVKDAESFWNTRKKT